MSVGTGSLECHRMDDLQFTGRVYLPTASIHSIGEIAPVGGLPVVTPSLASRGADDLLQLASLLAIVDRIVIPGAETASVDRNTDLVIQRLCGLGISRGMLSKASGEKRSLGECDLAAAKLYGASLRRQRRRSRSARRHRRKRPRLNGTRPRLSYDQKVREEGVHKLIRDRTREDYDLPCNRAGSAGHMLNHCELLFDETRRVVRQRSSWTETDTLEWITVSREWLNLVSSVKQGAIYVTCAARRQMRANLPLPPSAVQRLPRFFRRTARHRADQQISQHLILPRISSALLLACDGDPSGLIPEALSLRRQAKRSRNWLRENWADLDRPSSSIMRLLREARRDNSLSSSILESLLRLEVEVALGGQDAPKVKLGLDVGRTWETLLSRWRYRRVRQMALFLQGLELPESDGNSAAAAYSRYLRMCGVD